MADSLHNAQTCNITEEWLSFQNWNFKYPLKRIKNETTSTCLCMQEIGSDIFYRCRIQQFSSYQRSLYMNEKRICNNCLIVYRFWCPQVRESTMGVTLGRRGLWRTMSVPWPLLWTSHLPKVWKNCKPTPKRYEKVVPPPHPQRYEKVVNPPKVLKNCKPKW